MTIGDDRTPCGELFSPAVIFLSIMWCVCSEGEVYVPDCAGKLMMIFFVEQTRQLAAYGKAAC